MQITLKLNDENDWKRLLPILLELNISVIKNKAYKVSPKDSLSDVVADNETDYVTDKIATAKEANVQSTSDKNADKTKTVGEFLDKVGKLNIDASAFDNYLQKSRDEWERPLYF